MEQGSMRADVNISLREVGFEGLNTKVEIKNMNSMKEVFKAIKKEESRQLQLYTYGEGHKVVQETRRWDQAKGRTLSMRSKEDAHDYRYFPEPDLPPVKIDAGWVAGIRATLPELPDEKKQRMMTTYGLKEAEVDILIEEKEIAEFFEATVLQSGEPRESANWIITEVLRVMKHESRIPLSPRQLADLVLEVREGTISRTAAKEVFEVLLNREEETAVIIEEMGLKQISSAEVLEAIIQEVLDENPQAVADYRAGRTQSFGFLMGRCMKASKGKGNPGIVKQVLEDKLGS